MPPLSLPAHPPSLEADPPRPLLTHPPAGPGVWSIDACRDGTDQGAQPGGPSRPFSRRGVERAGARLGPSPAGFGLWGEAGGVHPPADRRLFRLSAWRPAHTAAVCGLRSQRLLLPSGPVHRLPPPFIGPSGLVSGLLCLGDQRGLAVAVLGLPGPAPQILLTGPGRPLRMVRALGCPQRGPGLPVVLAAAVPAGPCDGRPPCLLRTGSGVTPTQPQPSSRPPDESEDAGQTGRLIFRVSTRRRCSERGAEVVRCWLVRASKARNSGRGIWAWWCQCLAAYWRPCR
jgi:hypothetical protein